MATKLPLTKGIIDARTLAYSDYVRGKAFDLYVCEKGNNFKKVETSEEAWWNFGTKPGYISFFLTGERGSKVPIEVFSIKRTDVKTCHVKAIQMKVLFAPKGIPSFIDGTRIACYCFRDEFSRSPLKEVGEVMKFMKNEAENKKTNLYNDIVELHQEKEAHTQEEYKKRLSKASLSVEIKPIGEYTKGTVHKIEWSLELDQPKEQQGKAKKPNTIIISPFGSKNTSKFGDNTLKGYLDNPPDLSTLKREEIKKVSIDKQNKLNDKH